MRLRIIILSVIILITHYISFSKNNDSLYFEIDKIMYSGIDSNAFPGGVLYISKNDSVLLHKAYGYKTYDKIEPIDKDDIFDLASVTKVTAATLAIMKLYEDGKINLDEKIRNYVSNFRFNKHGKSSIRTLMTHQAGWKPYIPYYREMVDTSGGKFSYKKRFFRKISSDRFPIKIKDSLYITKNIFKYIKNKIKKSKFEKEKKYKYSDMFFSLVPEIVSKITGMSLEEYLRKNFYDSMNAKTIVYNPLRYFEKEKIVPTERDNYFRRELIRGTVHDEGAILVGGLSGHAGLFGNAEDLAKIWNMYLQNGNYKGKQYLLPQTIQLFTTPQYINNQNHRGIGFDKPPLNKEGAVLSMAKEASYRSYGHSGFTGIFVWADPENKLLYIFLSNRVYPTRDQKKLYDMKIRQRIHSIAYKLCED